MKIYNNSGKDFEVLAIVTNNGDSFKHPSVKNNKDDSYIVEASKNNDTTLKTFIIFKSQICYMEVDEND